MRIEDISITRDIRARGWRLTLRMAGSEYTSDPIDSFDGLLLSLQEASACFAFVAGAKPQSSKRKPSDAMPLAALSVAPSLVVRGCWSMHMRVGDFEYVATFEDFDALMRLALRDAAVFFSYRLGKVSLETADRLSTQRLEPNPGDVRKQVH
jgi:hypothetical protein